MRKILTSLIFWVLLPFSSFAQSKPIDPLDSIWFETGRLKLSDADSFLIVCKIGLKMARDSGRPKKIAMFNSRLANAYVMKGYMDEAVPHALAALDYYDSAGIKPMVGFLTAFVGGILFDKGDTSGGLRYYWKAIDIARRINDTMVAANSLFNLGRGYLDFGNLDSAYFYYQESLKWPMMRSSPDPKLAATMDSTFYIRAVYALCKIRAQKGIELKPEPIYNSTMEWARREQDRALMIEVSSDLAGFLIDKGRYREALPLLDTAVSIEREYAGWVTANLYLMRARVLNHLGDLAGSLSAYESSIHVMDSLAEVDSREGAKEKMLEYEAAINSKEAERISKETQIQMARVQQERYMFWGVLICSLVLAVVIYRFARLRLNETRLEADRASVEMKLFSLRSQINPEFVTGCFDALAELVTGGKQKQVRAKAFVGELSAYYRNVLVIADKGVHSLEEELEFSGLFLDLQKNLSGEKIRSSIEVQDDLDTTTIQVPAMLLHPFLDSLIRYGVPGQSGEQEVSVSVYYRRDGPGIRMTGHVLEDEAIEKVVEGHGAVLMRQRLEQLSGKDRNAVIRFGSDEGSSGKVFVDLQLPVESE